ncbi:MAG TPA: hypothetical protein VLJ76_04015 [Gaiellaceae bacterium]|nr:hypothetical protein [Gaiellaceae bacterium]
MSLSDDLRGIADCAVRYAAEDEELSAVIATEPLGGARVYLCAYGADGERSWLAFDEAGEPIRDRRVLRDAVSIAGMVELAEETAVASEPDRELEHDARVASPAYLDEIGARARQAELARGDSGASPFSEAMKQAGLTIDGLAADIETHYKLELD